MANQQNSPQAQNEALLQAVVRGSEMGKNTLGQLLPMTDDREFKAELYRQQKQYRALNQKAHTALAALGEQAKGQTQWARMATHMGIAANTLTDRSTHHLAEMLIQGADMGNADCLSAQKDCPKASDGAKQLAGELCRLEQQGAEQLRQYL